MLQSGLELHPRADAEAGAIPLAKPMFIFQEAGERLQRIRGLP